jgi:polysaccharide export outer membrane protein
LLLSVFSGCGIGGVRIAPPIAETNPTIPESIAASALRPGDVLKISIQSVLDPIDLDTQVSDTGLIALRYIGNISASGLTPSQLAERIQRTYITQKIYRENQIDVSVSLGDRFVFVGGEVERQGRVLWAADLSLSNAITAAGGFSLYARETLVTLIRDGKAYNVNVRLARKDPSQDIRLLPGDQIEVPRSSF